MTEASLYKLTAPDGSPVHGGSGKWSLPNGKPGRWRSVTGELVPCVNGLHLLRSEDIPHWLGAGVLWTVEAGAERIRDADKTVVRRARLTGKAADITESVLRELAADFAEHVLHLYEAKYPKDMRPREAIAAARAFARGAIGREELAAAEAAAWAAAEAARAAAEAAAWAAAEAAAEAAARAAWAAAGAARAARAAWAARAAEHKWQAARIAEVLGLPT